MRVENVTYQKTETTHLTTDIYFPDDAKNRKTAVVFFFGGGWQNGTREHFREFALELAYRGCSCFTPDYRVGSRDNTTPVESLADAVCFMDWLYANKSQFGIENIHLSGGSAGGHLAACVGLIEEFMCGPVDKLLLLNPVLDATHQTGYENVCTQNLTDDVLTRISPFYCVGKRDSDVFILHGLADETVPVVKSIEYTEKMCAAGTNAKIRTFPDMGHGFFNFGKRMENGMYYQVRDIMVEYFCGEITK